MQNAPLHWQQLFSSQHKTLWKFEIGSSHVVYQGTAIKGTPIITKPLMDTPGFGKTCSGSLVITIYPTGTIAKGAEVNAYCRLMFDDGVDHIETDWVPQGKYYVSSRTGKNPLTLTCYDRMLKAGQTYLDKTVYTEWPQPMTSVVAEIASLMGVSIDGRTTIKTGADYQVSYPNEDVLMSEILGMVAVAHGGNWIMSEAGALRLVPLSSPAASASQNVGKSHSGFTLAGTSRSVTRVTLVDDANNEFSYGAATHSAMELAARCDYATQSLATSVYLGLLGPTYQPFQYIPYELSGAYLNPLLELGDTISVQDKNGNATSVILFSIKMYCTVSAACDAAAGTKEETEDEFPYKSPVELMLERTIRTDQTYYGNRINRSEGFVSELLVNGGAKAKTTLNASAFSMQVYENGSWQNRIYFDPISGKYVITGDVTLQGAVEFSDLEEEQEETFIHGGNITTGTLSASKITTGILQSANGNIKFDLDNGLFTVGSTDLETALSKIDNALHITATSQIFTKADGSETYSPASITLTAETSGSISTYQWYKDGTAISGATSSTLTVTPASISGNAATYKVVGTDSNGNTYTDVMTVAKVSDGHQGDDGDPGYTVLLSNEYVEIPVGVNKKPTSAFSTTCVVKVYAGLTELTCVSGTPGEGQFKVGSIVYPTGVSGSFNATTATLTITAGTSQAISDSGAITFNIVTGSGMTVAARIVINANLNAVVTTHDSAISTLDSEISLRVTETTYHTDVPIYDSTDPSTSWTAAEKTAHIGCLWYNTSNNTIKKWNGSQWVAASDSDGWAVHTESSLTLNADKISWMVASGTTASNFTLTDRAATLATQNLLIDIDEPNVSSAITGTASGASYGFSLTSDGYYTSTNGGVNSSYSMCLVTVTSDVDTSLYLDCINYGEVNYDYGVIGKLDVTLSNSIDDTASNILKKFTSNSLDVVQVKIDIPAGTHTFNVKYRKDSFAHGNYDYFKFKITQNQQRTSLHLKNGTTELSSATININGMVTFSDLSNSGSTTVINGGLIKTGQIAAQYLQLSGAIAFNDLSDYSTVNARINSATDIAEALADGTYSGGSFISGTNIYSPTLYANHLNIKPYNYSSGQWSGGYSLWGYYGSYLYEMLKIGYYQGDAPVTQFYSPAGGYASWNFSQTYMHGNFQMSSGSSFDFTGCTVTGISGAVAVFG